MSLWGQMTSNDQLQGNEMYAQSVKIPKLPILVVKEKKLREKHTGKQRNTKSVLLNE